MFVRLRRFSLDVTRCLRYSICNCAKALAPTSAKFRILGVHSVHQAGDLWQRGRRGQQTDSDQQEEGLVDIGGEGPPYLRAPRLFRVPPREGAAVRPRAAPVAPRVARPPAP